MLAIQQQGQEAREGETEAKVLRILTLLCPLSFFALFLSPLLDHHALAPSLLTCSSVCDCVENAMQTMATARSFLPSILSVSRCPKIFSLRPHSPSRLPLLRPWVNGSSSFFLSLSALPLRGVPCHFR